MFKKLILCLSLVFCIATAFSQDLPPKSDKLVTDFTGTLSDNDKQALENKLVAFNDSSSTQVAVVMIRSVGDYDISDYAVKLGRAWGIGQKDKNNGVLVLVALEDRKMTIQTGYGVEGALPDVVANQIIENDMKPNFRESKYYAGLDAAVNDIIKYTKGEYKADESTKKSKRSGEGGGPGGFIIIIIIIVVIFLISRGGGGGGGGKRIIGGRGGASPFWWLLAGNMLSGGGRSSGGGWGGGGSSGGGGGFGGFGGGSFGGGGSSGSW